MQRLKKPFIWLMLAALIITLLPSGFVPRASAAQGNYFIPDDLTLRNTTTLTLTPGADQVARDSRMYTTTIPTLTFSGTYSQVTEDSLKVKVERLTFKVTNQATGEGIWELDSSQFKNGNISRDTSSSFQDKFKVTNLPLFPGFNRITLSGSQNGMTRESTFYALFDQVPYVQDLKLLGSSYGTIYLNEGSEVVADKDNVSISGEVKNATEVTVSVNGGTGLVTTLTQTGKFFSPALNLKPGLNKITITVKSGADSVAIERSVYYFDKTKPFDLIAVQYNGADYDVYNKVATITEATTVTLPVSGTLKFSMLLNDTGNAFGASQGTGKGSVTLTDSLNTTNPPITTFTATETEIPAPDGVSRAYRLVEVSVPFSFGSGDQKFNLSVQYDGTYSTSVNINFKFLPGEIGVTGLKYMKDNSTPPANINDLPDLDGTQADKDTFYILVTADQAFNSSDLKAVYLPKGTTGPTITPITSGTATQHVFQITGFSSGTQQVKFSIGTSSASKSATITYATKNYIYVEGLYDGQTISVDSSQSNLYVDINGEYRDFENLSNPQFFVNGVSNDKLTPAITFNPTTAAPEFKISLPIDIAGPLYYGENRIKFSGVSMDGKGNSRTVVKELRLYILDTNVSNITVFRPKIFDPAVNFTGLKLNDTSGANTQLTQILAGSSEFKLTGEIYETSAQNYDLIIQGAGARIVNLMRGSESIFSSQEDANGVDFTTTAMSDTQITQGTTKSGLSYDLAVFNGKFVLRIKNIALDSLGSQVYNLELINTTGARTSQRLEISRVLAPYRILSPVPTVGDQIIVNKNFVRFDIEAEGATEVIIDKGKAIRRTDLPENAPARFIYDYVGLKPDKATKIKIQIVRGTETLNDTLEVYYTSAVAVDSQYMTEKTATKYSAFNKSLELNFPKGTVLKTANVPEGSVTKFYPDNKLLFGIADPKNGILERRNDYGNFFNIDKDERTPNGLGTLILPEDLSELFNSTAKTSNFTRVSDVYWINGGYGEYGSGDTYKPATNGLPPYSILPQYSDSQNFRDLLLREPERKLVPSQRGTLKLAFNKSVVDEAGTTVAVFRFTENSEWENIGGAVDTKNNTITVPFDDFGYYVVMKQSRGFSDITNHPWARNILNALYSKGIMANLQPNTFGADDLTTRGEFATLLVKGLNIPLNYDDKVQTYFDVVPKAKTDTWEFKYIETASRAGIITGITEGYFGVEEPVTREQAAMMISRALKLKLAANDSKLSATLAKQFLDSGRIDPYARPAVQAVYKAKIMDGQSVTTAGSKKASINFNPKNNMTRAEAGKVAVELLKKSSKIFPKNLS
ncbi:S-layer homology domain-containing protein [Paenibacillus phocaensis]|uniref:S-layer homology domain-containing protein n=1 Tax=Paenibacillus phocaensis TaxID=1776378 RepID=UPI000839B677|nr:S-layer homology domain-containing protein [Paenibacillus phocaensis]